MKRKTLSLLALSVCLGWGFSTTALAQHPGKMWERSEKPKILGDTPEIMAQMDIARDLAGDDYYLQTTQLLQCNDIDERNTVVGPPGPNLYPPDFMSTGLKEVPAIPTKVFDNVYYVGGMEVGGWVIDTGDGYIMLDSSYDYGATEIIEPNMAALGLDPAAIKYILITHAGPDHVGAANYFQENYGTEVIFNNVLVAPPWLPDAIMPAVTIMQDGDTLTLGDTTITMVHTPRSYNKDGVTPGDGFSYFIPVKIKGKPHLWATYGNTGIVGGVADKELYLEAMAHWLEYVDVLKPDIVMSSHPFVDASLDRMEIIRDCNDSHGHHNGWNKRKGWKNKECRRNPFLIGKKAARRYFEIMDQCALVQKMRQEAGLPNTGLVDVPPDLYETP